MTSLVSDSSRRIQVILDTAGTAQKVLEIANHLAGSLNLLLEGVFIEEEGLLDMSELPFLREISPITFLEQPIDPRCMRQSLAARARQLEDMMQKQAELSGVQCLFRTWRGHATLQTLSEELDAQILSVSGAPAYRQAVFKGQRNPVANLCLVLDKQAETEKLVTIVNGLSERMPVAVSVLSSAGASYGDADWGKEVRRLTARLQPRCYDDFQGLTDLYNVLSEIDNPILFIESDNPLLIDPGFEHLIKFVEVTVFIVR